MRINSKLLPNKIETIFSGVGTKASGVGTWVSTTMTKNPYDYDFLIVRFSNGGSVDESQNIVFMPKVSGNGILVYMYANSQYNASVAIRLAANGTNKIEHIIKQITGWGASGIYITNIQGIKLV